MAISIEAGLMLGALGVAAIATVSDVRARRIPNWLTLPALLTAVAFLAFADRWNAAAWSLASAAACALVPLVLWRIGAMGAGDVKLLAAMGALLGMTKGLELQMVAFVLVSITGIGTLVWRGQLMQTLMATSQAALDPIKPAGHRKGWPEGIRAEVRLAPAVLAATAFAALSDLSRSWP